MNLKAQVQQELAKAKAHLHYSYQKVLKIDLSQDADEETLETLESFASRFARFSDILIARYFRLLAREQDPAFRGSVIDLLNLAEKHRWIESAETWARIRALRNVAAHEYTTENVLAVYEELRDLAPQLLQVDIA